MPDSPPNVCMQRWSLRAVLLSGIAVRPAGLVNPTSAQLPAPAHGLWGNDFDDLAVHELVAINQDGSAVAGPTLSSDGEWSRSALSGHPITVTVRMNTGRRSVNRSHLMSLMAA